MISEGKSRRELATAISSECEESAQVCHPAALEFCRTHGGMRRGEPSVEAAAADTPTSDDEYDEYDEYDETTGPDPEDPDPDENHPDLNEPGPDEDEDASVMMGKAKKAGKAAPADSDEEMEDGLLGDEPDAEDKDGEVLLRASLGHTNDTSL